MADASFELIATVSHEARTREGAPENDTSTTEVRVLRMPETDINPVVAINAEDSEGRSVFIHDSVEARALIRAIIKASRAAGFDDVWDVEFV